MKVIKFYSPCCGQCKVVAMEFKKNPIEVPVEDVNVVENPEIAEKYNVILELEEEKDIFEEVFAEDEDDEKDLKERPIRPSA